LQKEIVKELFWTRKARLAKLVVRVAREKLCEYIDLTLAIETGDHRVLE
jgi:hypothetical protein